jgi:hypothetical protein
LINAFGKDIAGLAEERVWPLFIEAVKVQRDAGLRALAAKMATTGLTEAAAKPLLDAFDTTFAHLEEDASLLKRSGATADVFNAAFDGAPSTRLNPEDLRKR